MSQSNHTLSERARHTVGPLTTRIGKALHHAGVHPDMLTWAGLLVTGAAGVAIGRGTFVLAGWLLVIGGLFDVLDGATARARPTRNPFGGLLDSTLDRYADGVIFGGLGYYFAGQVQPHLMALAWVALLNSFVVSYVRARASAPDIGANISVGLFSRLERMTVLVVALWFHTWLLIPALWVLVIGTGFTVFQRMIATRRHIKHNLPTA